MLSNDQILQIMNEKKFMFGILEKKPFANDISLAWAVNMLMMRKPRQLELAIESSLPISVARNRVARTFYEKKCDYLLFIDTDILLPADLLSQLIRHTDKYDVVSALYFRKSVEHKYEPVAFKQNKTNWWQALLTWKDEDMEIDAVGMGCCLIPYYVVKEFVDQLEFPLFRYDLDYTEGWLLRGEEKYRGVGEDMYFCRKLKKLNLKLGLITSCRCKHVADYSAFGFEEYVECLQTKKLKKFSEQKS